LSFPKFAIVPAVGWLAFLFSSYVRISSWRFRAKALILFLAIASTLLLLLLLPTGSIDISDLWRFLGFASVPFLLVLGFWLFRHSKTSWVRLSGNVALSVLLLPTGLFFLLLCVMESGCTKRVAPIYSPDGKHLVLLQFVLQGALGDDYGDVYLRRSWWPFGDHVYQGVGAWDFAHRQPFTPEVKWLDNSHLLIRYADDWRPNDGRGGPAMCKNAAGAIQIICENTRAPSIQTK
jgi:hypothetical protein